MSKLEQDTIEQFRELARQGLLTQYEANWCIGAIRNRHGLTRATRMLLRNEVKRYINKAHDNLAKRKEQNGIL